MPRATVRVLALLELLQSGGVQPVRTLAQSLGVDERTVRRYAAHLGELGIPVETVRGRYGGYRVGAGYRLPPLMLDDDEAVAVVLALAAAPGVAARTASVKIRRVLPGALAARLAALGEAGGAPSPTPADARTLLTVAEAAHDRSPVVIRYSDAQGRETERTVLPWGIVAHGGRWYLTGPDSSSRDHRTFRIDRITSVHIGSGRFRVPAGFDATERVRSGLALGPWAHDVSVLVQGAPARVAAQLPPGVATAEPLQTGPGGAAGWSRVRLHAERLDWVAIRIAALDLPFVVERPQALRDELHAFAARVSARAAEA